MTRSNKKALVTTLLYLGVAVLLSNCGGGGGGSSPAPLPSVPLKTDTIRVKQGGDSWTYSVSGNITDSTMGGPFTISGTNSVQILAGLKTQPTGSTCRQEHTHSILTMNGNSFTSDDYQYFTQDASGNIYFHGEGDGSTDTWVTTPAVGYIADGPSPVTVGASLAGNFTFDNGDTRAKTGSVIGKEYASNGIANYESYKVNMTTTTIYTSGTFSKKAETLTGWFVPGIGNFVKADIKIQNYNGTIPTQELNITLTLKSTNVLY